MTTEMRICRICNREKPLNEIRPGKRYCYACGSSRERARLKLEMLEALGWKCECCGEEHPEFLTLQHKEPLESSSFNGLKSHQLYRIARSLGWPKDRYSVLCMNCNFVEGHSDGCPHRKGLSVGESIAKLRKLNWTLEHDYSIVTEKQREALKLGPRTQQQAPLDKLLKDSGVKLEDVVAYLIKNKNK